MPEPIENLYFNWLYGKVCDRSARSPSLTHYNLLKELHHIEFSWLILGDDNRADDGCDLRRSFLTEVSYAEPNETWFHEACSMLEMLCAFSCIAGFQTDDEPRVWFWIMLENLGLSEMTDAKRHNPSLIRDICDRVIWRTYDYTGKGGLFPLHMSESDQRQIEIWYQFSAFLFERQFN